MAGADGAVEVRLRRFEHASVVALAPPREGAPFGLGGSWRGPLGARAPEAVVVARPLGRVEGVVRGAPEALTSVAEVALLPASRAELGERRARVEGGRFSFGAVPAGEYLVGGPAKLSAGAPGGIAPETVLVEEGRAARVSLEAVARVEVVVRLEQEGPAEERLRGSSDLLVRGRLGVVAVTVIDDAPVRVSLLPGPYSIFVRGDGPAGLQVSSRAALAVPGAREVTIRVPAAGALRIRGPAWREAARRERTRLSSEERVVAARPSAWVEEGDGALLRGIPAGRYEMKAPRLAFDPAEVVIPAGGVAEVTAAPASGGGE